MDYKTLKCPQIAKAKNHKFSFKKVAKDPYLLRLDMHSHYQTEKVRIQNNSISNRLIKICEPIYQISPITPFPQARIEVKV
jgi:hypothetical protein